MISLRDVVTGFGNRDPLAEVWRRSLRGGGGGSAVITGVPPLRYIGNGKPLTDYLISGNALQDGTPSPEAPVDVVGCGVRTGNLAPPLTEWVKGYVDANGNIHIPSGIVKEQSSEYIQIAPDTGYVFSFQNGVFPTGENGPWRAVGIYDENKTFIKRVAGAQAIDPLVFNSGENAKFARLSYRSYGSTLNTMLNLGSTALPYEPYGFKLPLTVNGTEYPLYLGQVESTRRVKKLVLTGEENNWAKSTKYPGNFYAPLLATTLGLPIISTHAVYTAIIDQAHFVYGKVAIDGGAYLKSINLFIGQPAWTVEDLKSYLAAQYAAGTPVTVWYVLAEPETAIVNEPLMKIGDYADTISFAQSQVAIPTVNGENVLDVPTKVPPSQITIKGGISSV